MLADIIRQRLAATEFHPFSLVLVNGERIDIRHRDSLVFPSTLHGERRVYAPYVFVVGLDGETVVTRSISVPLIAQVIDEDRLNVA
jgi:hypothetical protein